MPFPFKELAHDDLQLTAEEKEVLRSQGLPIPTSLPLTSAERKALQSVRRRLKAKVLSCGRRVCGPFGPAPVLPLPFEHRGLFRYSGLYCGMYI